MDESIATRRSRHPGKKTSPMSYILAAGIALLILVIAVAIILGTAQLKLVLSQGSDITLEYGQSYAEPGASASLLFFKTDVQTQGQVDSSKLGEYTITYSASLFGKTATVQRTVKVVDTTAPTITLMHNENAFTLPGHEYQEEGFVAEDNYDGDITDRVQKMVADGYVHYKVTDTSGNVAEVKREIVYNDITAPELTLLGNATVYLTAGKDFVEPGFTAIDDAEGDISTKVQTTTDFNKYTPGTYSVTYTVTDNYGNSTQTTRKIVVSAVGQQPTIDPVGGVIYLTFDDGPSQHTLRLLDVLAKYDVKATFFVVGTAGIGHLEEIAAGGHALAMHSNTHDYDEIYASEDAFFKDLYAIQDKIFQRTGIKSTLMRFPGGSSNMVSRFNPGIMTRLTQAVEAQGFQYFDWNVDSKDAGGAKTADEVYNNVINGCKTRSVSVVLQHDIHGYSVDAVERIIQWGLANGYTFEALTPTSPTAHHPVNN
ncbi:MAG: polysaccharide deacetylase family protein [Oscillospiraceae bacterium]|nr:polysaccharide deacetylase family protein [Oscillospiraceae bacterium]